jgi:hypothetical protein
MEPRNRFQGMNSASLCSLAGRYDNPIRPRLLASIDCLKIPAQDTKSAKSVPGLLPSLKISSQLFFLFRWSACPSSSRRLTAARCATTGPGAQCPSAFPPSAPSFRIRPATAWSWRPIWITAWSADSSAGEFIAFL